MSSKSSGGSGTGSGSGSGTGSGSRGTSKKDHEMNNEEGSISDYKTVEGGSTSTKQTMDSGYRSLGTSQYNRSTGSSKSPGSNLSKSSGSGSSQFEYKGQLPPNLPSYKKKDKGHKKGKSKSSATKEIRTLQLQQQEAQKKDTNTQGETQASQAHLAQDDKALKVAALSQALNFIDKFRKNQENKEDKTGGPDAAEINDLASNLQEASQGAGVSVSQGHPFVSYVEGKEQISDVLSGEQGNKVGEGFCAAVSLNDGMVMHTTENITSILGYPKDMWIGRSFIDFVHPKDRVTFTNQITTGITLPFGDQLKSYGSHLAKSGDKKLSTSKFASNNNFFCRLRMYNGLRQGKFSVKERKTVYHPLKLAMCFKEIDPTRTPGAPTSPPRPPTESASPTTDQPPKTESEDGLLSADKIRGGSNAVKYGMDLVCLIITAIPLQPVYKAQDQEGPFKGMFMTSHSATCRFSMVEESAIPFTGYLPQDLEDSDIFQFYHPQDLPYLKEVYEAVMMEQGKPFRSRPYRFRVRNGGYILLETDWSCFINPWSRRLEFVIGKHTVLKGPAEPNVFNSPSDEEESMSVSEEILKESKSIQEEIKLMLTETVSRTHQNDPKVKSSTRRRKELASFMGSLLEEMTRAEMNKVTTNSRDTSVVLGNVSPIHDDISSETPPSYNQLNYNDNLSRFFNSQPKTLTEKEVHAIEACASTSESFTADDKGSPNPFSSCVESQTVTSESAHGGSHHRHIQHALPVGSKAEKDAKENNESADSNEIDQGGSGDSGTTRGDRRSNAGHNGTPTIGDSGSGDGSAGSGNSRSGGPSSSNSKDKYRPPILTEELLLVHNRGMEKRMIDHYKDNKKTELRFIKNQWRNRPSNRHGLKRQFKQSWKQSKQERPGHGHSRPDLDRGHGPANVPLWPPFSVSRPSGMQMPTKTSGGKNHSVAHSNPPMEVPRSAVQYIPTSAVPTESTILPQSVASHSRTSPVYPNIIPTYYIATPGIPDLGQGSRVATPAGFLVQATGQPGFLQQPVRYMQAPPVLYQPIESTLNQVFIEPPISRQVKVPDLRGPTQAMIQTPSPSPDLPDSVSVDSCINGPHDIVGGAHKVGTKLSRDAYHPHSSKFQRPTSRSGSRATSVKAEPGSALESNASASVKDKLLSPSYHGIHHQPYESILDRLAKHSSPHEESSHFCCRNQRISDNSSSDSSSSLYSLLKSSDDNQLSIESPNSTGEMENTMNRPVLHDPFWLQNVEVKSDRFFNYQLKPKPLAQVLAEDKKHLERMYQPSLVTEQLYQLYEELAECGEKPRSLLDESTSSLNINSSSSSESETHDIDQESANDKAKKHLRRMVKFDKFTLLCDADAPLPPAIKSYTKSRNNHMDLGPTSPGKSSVASSSRLSMMSRDNKSGPETVMSTGTSGEHLSLSHTSTSMGSSSAITVDVRSSSDDGGG